MRSIEQLMFLRDHSWSNKWRNTHRKLCFSDSITRKKSSITRNNKVISILNHSGSSPAMASTFRHSKIIILPLLYHCRTISSSDINATWCTVRHFSWKWFPFELRATFYWSTGLPELIQHWCHTLVAVEMSYIVTFLLLMYLTLLWNNSKCLNSWFLDIGKAWFLFYGMMM